MLNTLVLPDGSAKDNALLGIAGGMFECNASKSDCFGRNENALWIESVQDVLKAVALFTDQVGHRDAEFINEKHIGVNGGTAHFVDFAHFYVLTIKVSVKKR